MKFLEKVLPTKALSFLGIVLALFVVGLVGVEVAYIYKSVSDIQEQDSTTIAFDGQAERDVVPDLANVDLTVRSEADTPDEAQQQNSQKMNGVTEFLKSEGFQEEDLQTSNYSIRPVYEFSEGRARQVTGYEVQQTLNVKIRDFENIPVVLREAVNRGVNQVSSLNFTIEDREAVVEELIEEAVNDAKQKAQQRASYLDLNLGELVDFSYSTSGDNQPPIIYREALDSAGREDFAPNVEPGTNKINVNVNLTYEVN